MEPDRSVDSQLHAEIELHGHNLRADSISSMCRRLRRRFGVRVGLRARPLLTPAEILSKARRCLTRGRLIERPMTPTWYRHRGYAHFDRGMRLDQIEPQVSDPKQVATWAFFPFLHYKKVDEHIRGRAQAKVKKRPISYACHRDSHLYSYYANVLLNPPYERLLKHLALEDRVIAFRHGQGSNISMARRAFDAVSQLAPCTVYAFDISKFFDRMDHTVLKLTWKKILGIEESAPLPDDHYSVFKSLTRFSYVHRNAALRELRIGQRRFEMMNSRSPLCDPQSFRDIVRGRKLVVVNEKRYGIPQGSPRRSSGALSDVTQG